MVDVFDNIKQFLKFESNDDFYYLQILQRKKENELMGSNSRVIKNYYIKSIQHLEERYDEIKKLCNIFNARAMLRLNKRSFRKVAFKTMQNLANTMSNEEYNHTAKCYDRACGETHNDKEKKWIIDIDGDLNIEYKNEIISEINKQNPVGDKILISLPTKNGIHLITKPFELERFKVKYPDIDIHKDNPINLYIP